MTNDSGSPPLPRRVPGASGSPRPPVKVERTPIPEDLRQRVLSAIASELERDGAELRGSVRERAGVAGDAAATGSADLTGSTGLAGGVTLPYGAGLAVGAILGDGAAHDRNAAGLGTTGYPGNGARGRVAARGHGAVGDRVQAPEPGAADEPSGPEPGQGPEEAAPQPSVPLPQPSVPLPPESVPLPRRAPGTHGAPPPPAQLRREFLPPSMLGRRLDAEAHTEPLPKISGFRRAGPPAMDEAGPAAWTVEIAPPAAAAPPAAPAPPELPVTPPSAVAPPKAAPEVTRPGPEPSGSVPPFSAPPSVAPPAAPVFAAPVPPAPAGASPNGPTLPALAPYPWPADPGRARPDIGRPADTAVPRPPAPRAMPQAPRRPPRPGRSYRIAGLFLSVVALVVAGSVALVLSGRTPTAGNRTGPGPAARAAAAAARDRAAAWVAAQVSPTAVVACDPVTCQALSARGVPGRSLYRLGSQTTSPLRSQIIVATPAVRAQFGNVLGSVYAPAVLASFGSGAERTDIRATAQHGAAAYEVMLRADVASRKASGAQLLGSGRITGTALARQQLATGQVDGRLLIVIAQMAASHPMYILDFGTPAPGASANVPLRQVDVAESAHEHQHGGRAASAGYVRSMVTFLHAQHGQFRAASVRTVHLAGAVPVLRIEFYAPSPLGLVGPPA